MSSPSFGNRSSVTMAVADATSVTRSTPHLSFAGGTIRSWVVTPAGMLNIVAPGTFFTVAMARFISIDVETEMKRRHPRAARFFHVHDFSGAVGYEPEARRILTSWGVSRVGEVDRCAIVTSPSNALIRMAISTVEVVLRVAGMNIGVASDLRSVVDEYGLAPHDVRGPLGPGHG